MKRLLFILLVLAQLAVVPVAKADICPGIVTALFPIASGYQKLAVSSTAVALTAPSGARMALVQVKTNAVSYRDDGTAPTASEGVTVAADQTFVVCTNAVTAIRFIRVTSDAELRVLYYW